jgi:hypothetical protein
MGIVYWSPLSIFVSELGGGGPKIYVLVLPVGGGGALKILLVLRGGNEKIL